MKDVILVFDLSGVFFNDGLKVSVEKISKEYGLSSEKVEFVLNGSFAEKYRTGFMTSIQFWKNAKNYLKVNNISEIKQILFESYSPHKESISLIRCLRDNNIKVGFLSNGPRDRTLFLDKKYNFISLFDFGLFSFQAHAWKPDKKIYLKLIDTFKLNPENITYIDDRERDLKPAEKLGMNTVLFKSIKQLKDELKTIGIESDS